MRQVLRGPRFPNFWLFVGTVYGGEVMNLFKSYFLSLHKQNKGSPVLYFLARPSLVFKSSFYQLQVAMFLASPFYGATTLNQKHFQDFHELIHNIVLYSNLFVGFLTTFCIVASVSFSPRVIISLVPHAVPARAVIIALKEIIQCRWA